jgi:hypothetical protein
MIRLNRKIIMFLTYFTFCLTINKLEFLSKTVIKQHIFKPNQSNKICKNIQQVSLINDYLDHILRTTDDSLVKIDF